MCTPDSVDRVFQHRMSGERTCLTESTGDLERLRTRSFPAKHPCLYFEQPRRPGR